MALRKRSDLDWCVGRGVVSGVGKGMEVGLGGEGPVGPQPGAVPEIKSGQVGGLASFQVEFRHKAEG